MVVDFSDIKSIAKDFIDNQWDHAYMFQKGDAVWELIVWMGLKWIIVDFPPTAECIAAELFTQLELLYKQKFTDTIKLVWITLRETPTSYVEYHWW